MVIQIFGTHASEKDTLFQPLIEKKNGREIRLGRRVIGWSLADTIVLRREGTSQEKLCGYIRHFAKQRHVVVEGIFPPTESDPYLAVAREVKDYLLAFMDTPLAVCLENFHLRNGGSELRPDLLREEWFTQLNNMKQLKNEGYELVTLRYGRYVQQVETLLLSARFAPGSYEALTLPKAVAPKPAVRRRVSVAVKVTKAA